MCPSFVCGVVVFLSLLFPFLLLGGVCVVVVVFCLCFCCCCFPVPVILKELTLPKCVCDARVGIFSFRSAYGLIL